MSESRRLFIAIECEELPSAICRHCCSTTQDEIAKTLKQLETERFKPLLHHVVSLLPYRYPRRHLCKSKTITGPPVKAAYRDGEPTKAAIGFAKSRGKTVEDLITVESKKDLLLVYKSKVVVKKPWKSSPKSFRNCTRNGFSSANGLG